MEKIKNIKKYIINEKVILGIILSVLIMVYNFVWLNKSYVMAGSWADFYNGLIERGQIPYRDFYYYMPPFNLLWDHIILKMSFGYEIIYRLWRLLEKIAIAEILYVLQLKRVHPYVSCMGSFAAVILFSANVYDIVGDYNQTCQLLIALLCFFMIKYVENIDSMKKKFIWLFFAGICGGIMLLSKQTVTLACAFAYAVLLIVFAFLKKEKKIFFSIIYVAMGAAVPLIFAWIYLGVHHAIAQFFYQVFVDISAKGTLYSITIGKLLDVFQVKYYGVLAILCLFAAHIISAKMSKTKPSSVIEKVLIALSALFFGYYYADIFIEAWKVSLATGIVLLLMLQLATGFCAIPTSKIGKLCMLVILGLSAAILIMNPNNVTVEMCTMTSLFTYMTDLVNLIFIFLLLWEIFHIIWCAVTKEKADLEALVMVSAGIASGFTTMMGNGETGVTTLSAFLIIPAFIFIIFKDKDIHVFFPVRIMQVSLLIVFSICISQKLTTNYSWWGDSQASYWDKTETSNIDKLAGIKFSKREKNKIDGISNLIDYYTDENSVIWGFPYVKIYNYLLNNYNMSGFVPVTFYDVCADDYAIYEAELLSYNEPDIVVWLDIPNCMEVHEKFFRNGGRLGQRQIQKWFSDVKDSDYTLIGQVDNVFVYKLNDGTDISYTYIEHQAAVNETAVYDDTFEQADTMPICTLNGMGTKEQPYLISSTDDLETFRDLVNAGMNFAGQYIRQTADIDLSSCGNWEPIGLFGNENLFAGSYDGDGYVIEGLYINYPDENVGLFGQLAGTVVNVSVIDCNITGSCIGGIASHGIGADSRIINCMVTGELHSYGRAGGIADNMGGSIINCVTDVELAGSLPSGISGYYTNAVVNCYSAQGEGEISIDNGVKYTSGSIDSLNSYLQELAEEDYGQLLNEWQMADGKIELTHKY